MIVETPKIPENFLKISRSFSESLKNRNEREIFWNFSGIFGVLNGLLHHHFGVLIVTSNLLKISHLSMPKRSVSIYESFWKFPAPFC
jgi:hypothetical protein